MTGWNLPPGCTVADIDRAAGVDDTCEVCGKHFDYCICPECPVCGNIGDPGCYEERDEHSHGLVKTKEQIDSLAGSNN